MTDLLRIWDRQPNDTQNSWQAFTEYLNMPIYGNEEEKRSIKNVAKKLGHSSDKQCGKWSAKYNWVERAAAYDAYMSTKSLTIVETTIDAYRVAHIQRTQMHTAVLSSIVEKRLNRVLKAIDAGEDVDTMDIKRLVDSVDAIDIIGRRAAGMPTSFTGVQGEEPDYEGAKFIIGGDG